MTPEEKKRRCIELCFEAQYMDSAQYLRMMHNSTKRPWVGLTYSERGAALYDKDGMTLDYEDYAEAIEAKLQEKNQ